MYGQRIIIVVWLYSRFVRTPRHSNKTAVLCVGYKTTLLNVGQTWWFGETSVVFMRVECAVCLSRSKYFYVQF